MSHIERNYKFSCDSIEQIQRNKLIRIFDRNNRRVVYD